MENTGLIKYGRMILKLYEHYDESLRLIIANRMLKKWDLLPKIDKAYEQIEDIINKKLKEKFYSKEYSLKYEKFDFYVEQIKKNISNFEKSLNEEEV